MDVELTFADGRRFSATFFTLRNLDTLILMRRWSVTGEYGGGLFMWCPDMIVVRELSVETVRQVIENLLGEGQLETTFSSLSGADVLD